MTGIVGFLDSTRIVDGATNRGVDIGDSVRYIKNLEAWASGYGGFRGEGLGV